MVVEDLSAEERKCLLSIAFKEHYLRWIEGDSQDYHQIHKVDDRKLTARVLRRIAKRYRINRGIRRLKETEGDPVGKKLAEILTEAAPQLKKRPIRNRWVLTRKVAEDSRTAMNRFFPNDNVRPIVSGVTKLTWFLAPHGWTMFDRLARQAVGVGKMTAEKQAAAFYDQLSARQFCKHVGTVQDVLNSHGFGNLFAERVIDKYLMLAALLPSEPSRPTREASASSVNDWSLRVDQFIFALHARHANEVHTCAHDVATLADDQFMVAVQVHS